MDRRNFMKLCGTGFAGLVASAVIPDVAESISTIPNSYCHGMKILPQSIKATLIAPSPYTALDFNAIPKGIEPLYGVIRKTKISGDDLRISSQGHISIIKQLTNLQI